MLRRSLILALAALAATLVATAPSFAQRPPGPASPFAPPERERERDVPLSQVIRDLKMRYGGEQLDTRKDGDRYIISWLTGDGRRLTIEVDARNGRTISVR